MTPIYASDRIDLSGWYVYDHPEGDLVLWDGGFNRTKEYSRVGVWNPFSGQPIYRDPDWLSLLPQIPMYGLLKDDHLTVIDFPHVDAIKPLYHSDHPVWSLEDEVKGGPCQFFVSVLNGPIVLEDCEVAEWIRCRILPEDKDTALKLARENGNQTMARHPNSSWTRQRNPMFASIHQPNKVVSRIREVEIDEDGYVGNVTAWSTPEKIETFFPLYWGDQFPEAEVFKPTEKINLYIEEGNVLGYD